MAPFSARVKVFVSVLLFSYYEGKAACCGTTLPCTVQSLAICIYLYMFVNVAVHDTSVRSPINGYQEFLAPSINRDCIPLVFGRQH